MPNTVYVDFHEINKLQTDIMEFVGWWVHQKKTPIPYKENVFCSIERNIKPNSL